MNKQFIAHLDRSDNVMQP